MAGIGVSASTGVMNSLLTKLSILLSDQYKHLKGVRKDIEFFSRELANMNAALEVLANAEKLDPQTKVWRDMVRETAYDIEDCIDIFMHHHHQGVDKDGLLGQISGKIKKLRADYKLSMKIQELKARVVEHSESRDRYKVNGSISNSRVVEVDPRLPALFEEAKRLEGIDGPREEITQWLMEESDSDSAQLKVLSIVGFGGLGKTTLANQAYSKIKNQFECTAFVSVSRSPELPKIMKEILQNILPRDEFSNMEVVDDVQILIMILRVQLASKRYLIVIDDLWSIKAWDTIKCALVQNDKGSRVIITTRIQDIATACFSPFHGHVYQMPPLDEQHSRGLFFKRIFDKENGCPQQFKEISEVMLRKCKGVPLAIISIASLLVNQSMNVEAWEKIHNSLGSELDTNPTMEWMRHVLSLSYNDLSQELKTCLLYLAAYPEDSEIDKCDLLGKWIAEGFIREKSGLDLEEVAEKCFNELINRNMIQPSSYHYWYGEMLTCRVHDMMLDLIISKCTEESFITIVDRQFNIDGGSRVRRISHQCKNINAALAVEKISLSQVRSYTFFRAAGCMPLLSKFELLRVLDLTIGDKHWGTFMSINLSAANHLFLLRYLKVQGFLLELPHKFGKLENLMTLNISWARLSPTSNQSSDFTSLSSLRHLTLPVHGKRVVLRNGLSKLCNLITLSCFDIRNNSLECIRDLGELTNLRHLGVLYSRPCDVGDNSDTILAASLEKLGRSKLRSLACVVLDTNSMETPIQLWSNCLTRPRHLQKLHLGGLMPKVPNWIAHADRLAYLYNIVVQELSSVDVLLIAQLPCLTLVLLEAKTIPEKNIIIHPNTFPSLKHFHLSCQLSCLTFEPAAMPRLQRLKIKFDGRGQDALVLQEGSPVAGIEHLASLERISVDMHVKRGQGSKMESGCRDAINRHPKCQSIQIDVAYTEYEENREVVNRGKQQYASDEENTPSSIQSSSSQDS